MYCFSKRWFGHYMMKIWQQLNLSDSLVPRVLETTRLQWETSSYGIAPLSTRYAGIPMPERLVSGQDPLQACSVAVID